VDATPPVVRDVDTAPAGAAPLLCRKLRPGESGWYRELRLDSLRRCPDAFGVTYAEESALAALSYEQAIESGARERFVVAALRQSRPVGIIGFARRDGSKKGHRVEIVQVWVAPDARGGGAAATLLRTTLGHAFALDEIEQVELSVVADNAAARRLYARLGFEVFGLHPNYFKVGNRSWDQLLMRITRPRFQADARGRSS
jgi:RimJ/RimL family protein N-acetyltransferase